MNDSDPSKPNSANSDLPNLDIAGGQHISHVDDGKPHREPLLNLPWVISALAILLTLIHCVRVFLLNPEQDTNLIMALAFFPISYGDLAANLPYPNSGYWSPVSYSLLHGDWTHLAMNLVWMAAFGSPVAKRLGVTRFLLLTIIASIGGAILHLAFFYNDPVPMIGASGALSGYMGAASRFAFQKPPGGERGLSFDGPAMGLVQSFTNRQFLVFFGVWMAMNYLFGSGVIPIAGEGVSIAWQAHVGGFLAGLFVFSWLDPK